ncbi:PTS glucose transporter subunit IIA [Enterococcus hulanensis]|uniref:PTS glucose transporter subunit IIA n=1 Tax=Enterococcus hulanensis TaxID=2559929 RepID=A0ABU3F5G0_9ENTE|nr:PTS glucose transporter subunit IIA [Enterococcus hulanensis]MDT2602354.1 PTS glucose transporter subunit IIA [Enterococcus hulanensis]MDT2611749.1 PTS glucose transporter subunit IIA [Enterococcus hulanensis]MDT2618853.1 PTS glucose transporter subunit IIA [Enterococcus hulanensis]MDT2630426.1 PTS glucose transporter subunit IIA [Enterococcus hulanensis]MDT2657912.1 PTS glucose transporter subunit IIA [Enterococcus hulanensis]
MFEKFKKKKTEAFFAPVDGNFVPLNEVSDPVFSQKMMGEGFGIKPTSAEIYSPIKGTITTIFQTKHAIGLTGKSGSEVLIHIGLDTVELAGEPFDVHVKEGQTVDGTTLLVTADFEKVRAAGKEDVVLTLLTNGGESFDSLEKKQLRHGELLRK